MVNAATFLLLIFYILLSAIAQESHVAPLVLSDKTRQYLAQNQIKPGVRILPLSGVQYKVVKAGQGKFRPRYNSTWYVLGHLYDLRRLRILFHRIPLFKLPSDIHYRGSLVDGTVTDNTYLTGATQTVVPHTVGIKGWKEALLMMVCMEKKQELCIVLVLVTFSALVLRDR